MITKCAELHREITENRPEVMCQDPWSIIFRWIILTMDHTGGRIIQVIIAGQSPVCGGGWPARPWHLLVPGGAEAGHGGRGDGHQGGQWDRGHGLCEPPGLQGAAAGQPRVQGGQPGDGGHRHDNLRHSWHQPQAPVHQVSIAGWVTATWLDWGYEKLFVL